MYNKNILAPLKTFVPKVRRTLRESYLHYLDIAFSLDLVNFVAVPGVTEECT
jgi:hypothetical protein